MNRAATLFAHAQVVLLDFDGPVCSVFARLTASEAAASMLTALDSAGYEVPKLLHQREDPHNLLGDLQHLLPDAGLWTAEEALTSAEVRAVESAAMTDGLPALLAALDDRSYAIVSNNSSDSVEKFAALHLSERPPAVILGRPALRPDLMKPSPYLLNAVLEKLDRLPDEAVFVGDSVSDIQAGKAANVTTIGYANKPGKADAQSDAGAGAVITSLTDLIP